MLELYLSHPTRLQQMRNGPLAMQLDALAARLHAEGYRPRSACRMLSRAGDFNRTLGWLGVGAGDITAKLVDEYVARVGTESSCLGLTSTLDRLMRELREDWRIAGATPEDDPLRPFSTLFDGYASWMRDVRGLAEPTIDARLRGADRFLDWWRAAHPTDELDAMTGGEVLDYLREGKVSRSQISDLRQFCRYLQGSGITATDLSQGIPSVRRVRLAHERKHIPWEEVERLLGAAATSDPIDRRDRAVVMLSAQLGLRNGEIRHLRLDDVDWRRGVLRVVASKGGKSRELPLPERAGDALAEYVRHGRPYSPHREVFVCHRAPGGLLTTASAVAGIIRRLAKRAGVALPLHGANVLRHSLATHLVNHDVPIKAISDLLGHESIDTTAIYTLVDMSTLSRVAQPFPEEVAR